MQTMKGEIVTIIQFVYIIRWKTVLPTEKLLLLIKGQRREKLLALHTYTHIVHLCVCMLCVFILACVVV